MDEELRRLHREARIGLGRHHRLLNEWVVVDGVRNSYRGILRSVEEYGGGVALLIFEDCRALDALADTSNEVLLGDFELYSHAILGIKKQPVGWET